MFSVMIHRLPNFNHRLLHKPHKFTHIKSVVPKLGMILVLWMEFLTKKDKTENKFVAHFSFKIREQDICYNSSSSSRSFERHQYYATLCYIISPFSKLLSVFRINRSKLHTNRDWSLWQRKKTLLAHLQRPHDAVTFSITNMPRLLIQQQGEKCLVI